MSMDNYASFTSSRSKCVSKIEGKTNFARCLIGYDSDPDPSILRQIYATAWKKLFEPCPELISNVCCLYGLS